MSKTQLKKELSQLNREQVISLVLDLYSARKEAKAWLDFFVEPDLPSLYEKYRSEIEKELSRGKYSKCTARFSRVRKSIKEFESYGVEAESILELMLYALGYGLVVERRRYVAKTFITGMTKLASDILTFADKNAIFTTAHQKLSVILDGSVGTRSFINYIRKNLDWNTI